MKNPQLKKVSGGLKLFVAFCFVATFLACTKENLVTQNEVPLKNSLQSKEVELLKVDNFGAYLSSLPPEQKTMALLGYANEQKRNILRQNEAGLDKRRMNNNVSKSSTSSSAPSEIDAVGYTPSIDVDSTGSVRWTVVEHVWQWWKVEASDKVSISVKGDITNIEHEGSQLAGATVIVSWTEGIVQKHFTTHVAIVNVEGTISAGIFSDKKSGIVTLNGPKTRI